MSGQDEDMVVESGSSGPGTPMNTYNAETPRSINSDSLTVESRNTPPLTGSLSHSASSSSLATSAGFGRSPSVGAGLSVHSSSAAVQSAAASQSKYAQLLAVIEDMGKDIRPTYAGSKTSTERLKRGIMHARILVRECLMECDRAART